jgi:hypothetical protein
MLGMGDAAKDAAMGAAKDAAPAAKDAAMGAAKDAMKK